MGISGSKVRALDGPPMQSGTPRTSGLPDCVSMASCVDGFAGGRAREVPSPGLALRCPAGNSLDALVVRAVRGEGAREPARGARGAENAVPSTRPLICLLLSHAGSRPVKCLGVRPEDSLAVGCSSGASSSPRARSSRRTTLGSRRGRRATRRYPPSPRRRTTRLPTVPKEDAHAPRSPSPARRRWRLTAGTRAVSATRA